MRNISNIIHILQVLVSYTIFSNSITKVNFHKCYVVVLSKNLNYIQFIVVFWNFKTDFQISCIQGRNILLAVCKSRPRFSTAYLCYCENTRGLLRITWCHLSTVIIFPFTNEVSILRILEIPTHVRSTAGSLFKSHTIFQEMCQMEINFARIPVKCKALRILACPNIFGWNAFYEYTWLNLGYI